MFNSANRIIYASSLFLFMLSFSAVSVSGWFGPQDYDDCILEHMKGVSSSYAVSEIRRSCLQASRSKSWFGPSDFDKCILENMEGITSDDAAMQVKRSCIQKKYK